ncbi:MAG: glycosyltransferase [Phycisphaeraceae bacterium]|nr:glycosyltransferase [Phycisphaeraceae bacterium]
MTTPLSIVIPAYNAERTIEQAVASVLAQSHEGLELVVVDDGSTDGTFERVARVRDPRMRVIRTQNRGVAAARNRGLSMVEGDFVGFLDADDAFEPDFARSVLDSIGNCDAIATAYRDADHLLRPSSLAWYPAAEELTIARLRETNPLAPGATVFRTDALHHLVRTYGEAFPADNHIEDWEMLLRFTALGAKWARPIERPLLLYRLTQDSRSSKVIEIWKDGCDQIGRWVPRPEQDAARRRWTLRQLMRALFAGQAENTRTMLSWLGELRDSDRSVLEGAARSLARREAAATGSAPSGPSLGDRLSPLGQSIATNLTAHALAPSWDTLAVRASQIHPDRARLVIYGFGRNGREAARALELAGIAFHVCDDNPAFRHERAIAPINLTPLDLVLVTPDDRGAILARLRSFGHVRLFTVDHLRDQLPAAA